MHESIQFENACLFSKSLRKVRKIYFHYRNYFFLFQGIREKSWSSIIPNSQLIIIPYPNDDPSRYANKNK